MRLFLDQDVYAETGRFLRDLGHDVVSASDMDCSQATDSELLEKAQKQGRVLVTRDRDFGALVFLKKLGSGVIYLRVLPSAISAGHKELGEILTAYSEEELRTAFVIVEPGGHRFRRLTR